MISDRETDLMCSEIHGRNALLNQKSAALLIQLLMGLTLNRAILRARTKEFLTETFSGG